MSLTKELFTPFKDPKREFCSSRKIFKTLSLDESRSPEFGLFSVLEENSEEEPYKHNLIILEEKSRRLMKRHRYAVSSLMDMAYRMSESVLHISSFKLQNACLLANLHKIAKPITPPYESASEEDSNPEQAQRDKDMQKNLALIAKYFKRTTNLPTTNSELLQTPETKMWLLLQGMQKPKRVKDSTYHKENMLLCKQAEQGVPLQAEHTGQNAKDERVALANLIAYLKLDVDENKKIQKQLKNANKSLTHELEQCKSILVEHSKTLEESNSVRDCCLVGLQIKQTEFEKYKACNDRTVDYDKLERKLNETLGLLAQKDIDIKVGLKLKAYEILVVKEKHDELVKQSLLIKSHYEGLVKEKIKSEKPCLYEIPNDQSDPINRLVPDTKETLTLAEESRSKLNKDFVRP
nr:hypothetical protein [Tanacetum cinerariifolium]